MYVYIYAYVFVFHSSLNGEGLESKDFFPRECVCLGVRVVNAAYGRGGKRKGIGCLAISLFALMSHVLFCVANLNPELSMILFGQ